MIGLTQVYALAGLVFAGFAVLSLRDAANPRRLRNALFWGLFALSFLAGDRLGDLGHGFPVLFMALTAALGLGRSGSGAADTEARAASARTHGLRLFWPALLIPVLVLAGSLGVRHGRPALAPSLIHSLRRRRIGRCWLRVLPAASKKKRKTVRVGR